MQNSTHTHAPTTTRKIEKSTRSVYLSNAVFHTIELASLAPVITHSSKPEFLSFFFPFSIFSYSLPFHSICLPSLLSLLSAHQPTFPHTAEPSLSFLLRIPLLPYLHFTSSPCQHHILSLSPLFQWGVTSWLNGQRCYRSVGLRTVVAQVRPMDMLESSLIPFNYQECFPILGDMQIRSNTTQLNITSFPFLFTTPSLSSKFSLSLLPFPLLFFFLTIHPPITTCLLLSLSFLVLFPPILLSPFYEAHCSHPESLPN